MSLNFIAKRDDLLVALSSLQNITSRKTTMAILANILVETSDNGIILTGSDMEVGMRYFIPANIQQEGSLTLPAKKFYEIVRESGSKDIHIDETLNSWVIIKAGMSMYNLAGIPSDDYPQFPEYDENIFVDFASSVFLEMIDKIIFSIANDQENIYSLTNVLIEKEKNNEKNILKMISSDGHRLSIIEKEVNTDVEQINLHHITLIPKKGIQEWKKFCEARDRVFISFEEKQLIIKDKNAVMVVRLKTGEFPDYKAILQAVELDNCAFIKRIPFLDSLKRINLFTEDIFYTIQLNLDNNLIVLSSQNPELGNAKDEIEVVYQGDPLLLGFNCKYFIDSLQVMHGETVEVYISSNSSPCLLRSADDPGFTSVIMPMQL
jgi:DNA polymerase III subunit beta